jgi:hypothetical protein
MTMSEDEIIQMAVECGIIPWTKHEYIGDQKFTATDDGLDGDAASLIQFFQMAVAHERQECVKVCEDEIRRVKPIYSVTAENILKGIQSRGKE